MTIYILILVINFFILLVNLITWRLIANTRKALERFAIQLGRTR